MFVHVIFWNDFKIHHDYRVRVKIRVVFKLGLSTWKLPCDRLTKQGAVAPPQKNNLENHGNSGKCQEKSRKFGQIYQKLSQRLSKHLIHSVALKLCICLHCIGSVFASFAKRYGPSVNSFGPRPSIALVFSCINKIFQTSFERVSKLYP
jgi:hypothetical protein